MHIPRNCTQIHHLGDVPLALHGQSLDVLRVHVVRQDPDEPFNPDYVEPFLVEVDPVMVSLIDMPAPKEISCPLMSLREHRLVPPPFDHHLKFFQLTDQGRITDFRAGLVSVLPTYPPL